jgi:hypothetical protein
LAVNTGEAAKPLSSVVAVAVVTPPAKVPLAPDVGAVKVTVTPVIGDPPDVTHASSWAVKAAPTEVLCPDPLSTDTDTAAAAGALWLLSPHAINIEAMASAVTMRADWRVFIARLHPVQA